MGVENVVMSNLIDGRSVTMTVRSALRNSVQMSKMGAGELKQRRLDLASPFSLHGSASGRPPAFNNRRLQPLTAYEYHSTRNVQRLHELVVAMVPGMTLFSEHCSRSTAICSFATQFGRRIALATSCLFERV